MGCMAKSQHALIYRKVPTMLRRLRESAELTQRDLAVRLSKSQPWVHKSEIGERRVDISEFIEWVIACGVEPEKAFRELLRPRR